MTTSKSQLRGISNLISIDRRASEPLYRQIYESFRSSIVRGGLRPGGLVLSTRSLAGSLRISRLPVLNAYSQLLAEGYFESRVGSGTFIASSLPGRINAQTTKYAPSASRGKRSISGHAAALPPYERPSWAESLGPFQGGQPDLHKFPIETWLKLVGLFALHAREGTAIRGCDGIAAPARSY